MEPRRREYGPVHDCKDCGVPVYFRIDRRGAAADAWLIEERTGAWHTCCRFEVGDLNIYEPEPPAPVKKVAPVMKQKAEGPHGITVPEL